MASLPSATTRLKDESGGVATGTDLLYVISPVSLNADKTPRLWSGAQALYDYHGYAQGVSYAASHFSVPKKPIMFSGVPITTPGTVGRFDTSGRVTGTSVASIAVGAYGSLEETDGILTVAVSGTRGTNGAQFDLSCDGGRTYKRIKLGTATTYTIPYVGLVISFAAGTFVAGETILTWHSTAPKASSADITLAKAALAAQTKKVRSWLLCQEITTLAEGTAIQTIIDAYETTNERYALVKLSMRDRYPFASMSKVTVRMTGDPNLTFTEVGGTGDTITRSAGSFVADGFVAGDRITVTGTTTNPENVFADKLITNVAATILTLDDHDLVSEGPVAGLTLTGTPGLTFAEAGANDTITRSRGSWLADGFRTGDNITISGTASNNITTTAGCTVTSATVLTMGGVGDDLAAELIGTNLVTITAGETDAVCIAALDSEFATLTDDPRVDLGYGRGAMVCPITGWKFRRNANWHDTLRAYQYDIKSTTWEKDKGPLTNCDLNDEDGEPYEHDERTTQGALAAGFTCLRTWDDPPGAFVAQSLTRALSTSVLSMTHNAYIANLFQTICQSVTQNFAGKTLVLMPADNTGKRVATTASLDAFAGKVNDELARYLLSNIGGEGARASVATWTPATDDDLGVADAILHGSGDLQVNGTIVHVDTQVRVR